MDEGYVVVAGGGGGVPVIEKNDIYTEVEACIEFVEAHPGGSALITSLGHAAEGLRGETGTLITSSLQG